MCSRAQHVLKRQASKWFANFFAGFFLFLSKWRFTLPFFKHVCHGLCTDERMIRACKWSQIGPELIPPQKVKNGVDSVKSSWMDTYFNYSRWRKTATSAIKAAITNVEHTAQITKLMRVDCTNFPLRNALQKKKEKKKNLRIRLCL